MRILVTTLILLFVCGCTLEPDSNENSLSNYASDTIISNDPLASIDLNDVYNGFISYVKDVQEKYKKGELEQPDETPSDPNKIYVEGFNWIYPKYLGWYLNMRPVELLWASSVILVFTQDVEINGYDAPSDKKWGVIMNKNKSSWIPQSVPKIVYSYYKIWPQKTPPKIFENPEMIFSPEENYFPPFNGTEWNYTWPHDLLPSTFNNAKIISSPIEPNVNNKGKTRSNLLKPVVVLTSNNIKIEITCNKRQKVNYVRELGPIWDYKQMRIDGKNAWIGHYDHNEMKFTMIQFFEDDVLYEIQQNGEYNKNVCYDIIKQITEFMQRPDRVHREW